MSETQEEIISEIGQSLMRAANSSAEHWDYAGYAFETRDGKSSGGTMFLYDGRTLLDLEFGRDFKTIVNLFKHLREVTRVEGDDYWIKCKVVLRQSDGNMKMLFEFDDWSRWSIAPSNVDQSYEILLGDIFPEALEN